MRDSELLDLVDISRANNFQMNVTGVLLYADGSFVQVLEGGPPTVEKLVRKIRRDARHRGFITLLDRVADDRDFEGWSMGFRRVSQQDLNQIAGYHDWSAEMPTRRKIAAGIHLIESFRRSTLAH